MVRPALERALVLARLGEDGQPPVAAPPSLRPFLRFATLPARALAPVRRALDTDDEFRSRVAAATTEEDVGRAGWLLLHRPEGWAEELEELARAASADAASAADERDERMARRR